MRIVSPGSFQMTVTDGSAAVVVTRDGKVLVGTFDGELPEDAWQVMSGNIQLVRAGRNIAAGEELTYDYHTDGEMVIQCRCRPGCRRRL